MHLSKGFIYIWALAAVALAGVLMAGVGQVWQTKSQREKEQELLFVGEQFRKAFLSYYDGTTGGIKQYPESLEQLLLDKRAPIPKRHLRKIFLDPMTNSAEWGLVAEPPPEKKEKESEITTKKSKGIIGVYSLSKRIPIKIDNFSEDYAKFTEATTYQDWQFIHIQGSENKATAQTKPPTQSGGSSAAGSSPFSSQPSAGGSSSAPPGGGSSAPPPEPGKNPFAQ